MRINGVNGISANDSSERSSNPMVSAEYRKLWENYKQVFENTNWSKTDLQILTNLKMKMDIIEARLSC